MRVADELAAWATALEPSPEDDELARRSLLDTLAVMLAARDDPLTDLVRGLSEPGQWAALAHVLDFDDLHLPSTAHLSAICVPAALAGGGDARAYLAGAGAMARLGIALGWEHYRAGWHATCTAGAPAAAIAAGVARGLDSERIATAVALAIPAAGGVQRAFGTAGKALQVGFATDAGVRAAALAAAGASADPSAVDDWLKLVGGDPGALPGAGPVIPGGLAIKPFPCCYALQRPIAAVMALGDVDPAKVRRVTVVTPASSLAPLIHHRPVTGLEGKFSLEYGMAAALLDGRPDARSFTDAAVQRPEAQRLIEAVEVSSREGSTHLLAGEVSLELEREDGEVLRTELSLPPGAPERPLTSEELEDKLRACAGEEAEALAAVRWDSAAEFLRARLGAAPPDASGDGGGTSPAPTRRPAAAPASR